MPLEQLEPQGTCLQHSGGSRDRYCRRVDDVHEDGCQQGAGTARDRSQGDQNIEERLAAIQFPEPDRLLPSPQRKLLAEPVAEAELNLSLKRQSLVAEAALQLEEAPVAEKQAAGEERTEGKVAEEQEDDEHAKDGVSLDELFSMKPEIFQTAATEEDDSADKKKGKKGKKKSVELEFDEERGEVVGRKKHKRGDDELGEDW